MKRIRLTVILAVVAVLCLALAACQPPHEHQFGQWHADETNHWKTCSCGQKSYEGAHTFGSWVVDEPATETEAGSKHAVCTECGYRIEETIPATGGSHQHEFSDRWYGDEQEHWHECACGEKSDVEAHTPSQWITDVPATENSEGSRYKQCTVCGRELQRGAIPVLEGARTVELYAINDCHGQVDKMPATAGYLAQQKNNNPNTVLINSGDMFQGSMESNSNYGQLLADCMDEVGFDCLTYGNHEFDWGLDKVRDLVNNNDFAFLGANIYEWDAQTKTWGDFADDIAQEYIVKTLDNGLKVGVIGVIGSQQITSISSQLVQTIGFKDPAEVIPPLAEELRNEQGCDVVVVSAHCGSSDLLASIDVSQYADAVFCAHTHREERFERNGVPFLQGGSNGYNVAHIVLTVENGEVTCDTYELVPYDYSWPNLYTVEEMIDNSNEALAEEANQVLAYLENGSLDKYETARLACHAIAEYALQTYGEIDLAMVNGGRDYVNGGDVTYSQLYSALPFDNQVYVAKVLGSDILYEARYNEIYRVSGEAIYSNQYYYVAVIDYLLFHQDSDREYDYFPSAFESGFTPVPLTKQGEDIYNYRLITRDFLLEANVVDSYDYTRTNNRNDTSLLQTEVTFDGGGTVSGPEHAGTMEDPYSVADAILMATGKTSADNVYGYVRCQVSDVSGIRQGTSGDLGNFYVTDGAAEMYVYFVSRGSVSSSQDGVWNSTSDLQVGDDLVIYAQLYTYNGSAQIGGGYAYFVDELYPPVDLATLLPKRYDVSLALC